MLLSELLDAATSWQQNSLGLDKRSNPCPVEVIVNVGMTVGLMPITGLTLPLVSYGGSSLVVSMTAIGLLNNIGRSRPFTVAPRAFEQRSK